MRARLCRVAGWCALAVLVLAAFANAGALQALQPAVSLRYQQPLQAQQVGAALDYALGGQSGPGLFPTFWGQALQQKIQSMHATQADVLYFVGEGEAVWPAHFLQGGWPGPGDTAGCAVSSELAWQLYGSGDVVGQTLTWQKRQYTVRGVFGQKAALLLARAAQGSGFTAVELGGPPPRDPMQAGRDFALAAGLEEPWQTVCGPELGGIALLLTWLPAVWAGLLAGRTALGRLRALPKAKRQAAWLLLAVAAAALLPALLAALPAWLLPAQWGSPAAWAQVAGAVRARWQGWLGLAPALKDVAAKQLLAAQAVLCLTALWLEGRLAKPKK